MKPLTACSSAVVTDPSWTVACVVQAWGQLLQLSGSHQVAQMPIHRRTQACEILPAVNAPGLKLARKVRSSASQSGSRRVNGGKHGKFFIEISCT
ncbi:hypothetical protein OIN59_17575 [Acidovorax sp. D2M1]|uniref:Uncharacterized protein n=1 Tax=Acidovorax benzenivorans TaxID=2987520 RepID=A0ABT5RZW6_9BURK|nr:hypothetical protein [Acidovorax benzenivorans]MDD2179251.1 hypothetical protein [Acidovorax benzenivorans]